MREFEKARNKQISRRFNMILYYVHNNIIKLSYNFVIAIKNFFV